MNVFVCRNAALNAYRSFTRSSETNLLLGKIAMSMICWCCLSQEARAKKRISDAIDKILMEEEKNLRKEFKLLLLGGFVYNYAKVKVSCLFSLLQ